MTSARTWEDHLARPEDLGVRGSLRDMVPAFLRWQVGRWPRLAEAVGALAQARTRPVRVADRELALQWNPARATSSTAKVDPASIQQRACFLCPVSFPPEEGGLPFGPDLVILPNPAPILRDHLVIAHRAHRPQRVVDALPGMFALAATSGLTTLYNGPRCGASAPDHLHLQAVAPGQLPEEQRVFAALDRGETPGDSVAEVRGARVWRAVGAGREIVGFAGPLGPVERAVREAIAALGEDEGQEPRVNVVVRGRGDGAVALLFPRGAHRPAAFFAEGDAQRVVSPGVIDMAGVVVAVRQSDFERLTDEEIAGVFQEVTLSRDRAEQWLGELARRWADG